MRGATEPAVDRAFPGGLPELLDSWRGAVRSPAAEAVRPAVLAGPAGRVSRPARRVAIACRGTSVEYASALLAAWRAGDVPVAIDTRLPLQEVRRRLALAAADLVVAAPELAGLAEGLPVLAPGDRWPEAPRHAAGGELALVVFTSGTTGRAHAVGLTHDNLVACAANVVAAHRLTPADRCLNALPLAHVNAPVIALLATALAGGDLVQSVRFDPRRFWRDAAATGATWANLAPPLVAALVRSRPPEVAPTALRFVRTASAPLPPALLERFERAFGVAVVESYGISEAAGQVTANDVPPGERRAGWVGWPRGVEVRVVDDAGTPMEPGAAGEVVVRGPTVMPGYLDDEAATAERLVDGWLRTGDLGVLDDTGCLRIVGRLGELINRGGEKIAPRAVEEAILELPGIVDAAVCSVPDEVQGEEVAALVVTSVPVTAAELNRHLASRLPVFARPRLLHFVKAVRRSRFGKVDRAATRALAIRLSSRRGSAAAV